MSPPVHVQPVTFNLYLKSTHQVPYQILHGLPNHCLYIPAHLLHLFFVYLSNSSSTFTLHLGLFGESTISYISSSPIVPPAHPAPLAVAFRTYCPPVCFRCFPVSILLT